MILLFAEEHKRDLSLFRNSAVPEEFITEFCNLSIQFIESGENKRIYTAAAKKLQIEPEEIEQAINALAYLFIESAKAGLSQKDFEISILDLNIDQAILDLFTKFYVDNLQAIRAQLSNRGLTLPQYKDLQWRLDVEMASRTMRSIINPTFMLKLDIQNGEEVQSQLLETNYTNLRNICTSLENALKDVNAQHARRIRRYIN
eukprot:GEZU01020416.1.p2 GENE.GEZU01020416.1~~GEZU01020416.1.p2  ORF type:complete len:213 (-),score=38.59 GEZU01020416.1:1167-1772(-)